MIPTNLRDGSSASPICAVFRYVSRSDREILLKIRQFWFAVIRMRRLRYLWMRSQQRLASFWRRFTTICLERAKAHRDSHTYVATTLDEMKEIAENKPGFIKAMWCGNQECEDKLKEVVGVTSRCIPFNQEHLADTCVCCGKPATKMVYWGKAY